MIADLQPPGRGAPRGVLTTSQPLHCAAVVVFGIQTLDVVAWTLTTVGMAAAAVALVRREPWRGREPSPGVREVP